MGITVTKILKIPLLEQSQIMAGKGGLHRIVDGIAVMESSDSVNYIYRNNILLTNSQLFSSNTEFFKTTLRLLDKKGAAGMFIKLNRYLKEIPQEVIALADDLNFPILSVPKDLPSTDVINTITYEILYSNAYDPQLTYAENFLRELLSPNMSRQTLQNRAQALGWRLNQTMGFAVIWPYGDSLVSTLSSACTACGAAWAFPMAGTFVAAFPLEQEDVSPEQYLHEHCQSLSQTLKKAASTDFYLGVGSCCTDLIHARNTYLEALNALSLAATAFPPLPLVNFEQMGIYRMLLNPKNKKLMEEILEQTIGALENYDRKKQTEYVKTLNIFLEERESIEKTAAKLYIHYNSVRYRLQKIEQLLNHKIAAGNMDQLRILLQLDKCRRFLAQLGHGKLD